MSTIITNLLVFLLTIFVLVVFHEFGHFVTARWLGVPVKRFSIGFGQPIWRYQGRSGTEYAVGYLPLGGYVKLLDEREDDVPEFQKHLAFNRQSAWRRFVIIIAGAVMNIILAIMAYFVMFLVGLEVIKPVIGEVTSGSIAAQAGLKPHQEIVKVDHTSTRYWQQALFRIIARLGDRGTMTITTQPFQTKGPAQTHTLHLEDWEVDALQPNPLLALGIKPFIPQAEPVVHFVKRGSAAAKAGLKPNDKIVTINDQSIASWRQLIEFIQERPGEQVQLTVLRDQKRLTLTLNIGKKQAWLDEAVRGYIGIGRGVPELPESMQLTLQYPPHWSLWEAVQQTWLMTSFNYLVLWKLITGDLSLGTLGGPISIFQASASAFGQGIAVYMNFLGLINIMLAILNTLPIPGLDGGHILMLVIEKIIRRPVPMPVQVVIYRLGLIALIVLLFHATMNDLMRML